MPTIFYALIPVFAWGTWLAPSQNVRFNNQQIKTFYVGVANLGLAFLVAWLARSGQIDAAGFWPPFIGGLVWAVSAFCAFTATNKIGIAKAFGIWAPLNIIVSMIWGGLLFGEFVNTGPLGIFLLVLSIGVIIGGVLMIIFARGGGEKTQDRRTFLIGVLGAVAAGILWGSYFIPIKLSGESMWVAAFPMAIGIFVGSTFLAILPCQSFRLEKSSDYLRVFLTGILWAVGNYGSLLLIDLLGAGKGFTISQLSIVVNALVGIYLLKDPLPGTRVARLTLAGCIVAMVGGILLVNLP